MEGGRGRDIAIKLGCKYLAQFGSKRGRDTKRIHLALDLRGGGIICKKGGGREGNDQGMSALLNEPLGMMSLYLVRSPFTIFFQHSSLIILLPPPYSPWL